MTITTPALATARRAALGVALGGLLASAPLAGQIGLGAQASSADNAGFGIGPRVVLDLGPFDAGLRVVGSFDFFFPGDGFEHAEVSLDDIERAGISTDGIDQSYWEVNLNLLYTLAPPAVPIVPYVGGGLNFAHTERSGTAGELIDVDDTDRGLNLLAGLELDVGGVAPFLEGRLEVGGGEQWVVTGGIVF